MSNFTFSNQFTKYSFPKLGYIKIPKYKITPEEQKAYKLKSDATGEDFLVALIKENLTAKLKSGEIPEHQYEAYRGRVREEFEELKRLLFIDYILLVYKIIKFCKENKILNGPARGSAGGSQLLWLIGVVQIDALKHKLLFERFVSAARTEIKEIDGEIYISSTSLPDVDLDSQRSKKHLINDFLSKEFPNKTVAISNVSTFQGKAVLKEVYKSLEEASEEEAKSASNLIETKFGNVDSIEESVKSNIPFAKWAKNHPDTIDVAQKLSGLNKNFSVHASGILITNDDAQDLIPLQLSRTGELVSAYDMNSVQMFGIKVDNLGLKNLDVINSVLDHENITLNHIDVNHSSIYNFINNSDCFYGVFQAEEGLGKNVLKKITPNNIEDIGSSVAIGRPGCMRFVDEISKHKKDGTTKKLDSRIDPLLSDTYGIIIFQEQIMALCRVMAKFTPLETNSVRKIIGKKLVSEMPKWKGKFTQQSIDNGYKKELVEDVWRTFEDSGNYLFNRCLSEDTDIELQSGRHVGMYDVKIGDKIRAFNVDAGLDHFVTVKNIFNNNTVLFGVMFDNGCYIEASAKHKFLCEDMVMRSLYDVLKDNCKVITKLGASSIYRIKNQGTQKTLDFEVDHKDHNFYANNILVSNSHSCGYSYLTAICCYLKANYPVPFFCASLNSAKDEADPIGEISTIQRELRYFNIRLLPPHIIKSDINFTIEKDNKTGDNNIRFGLSNIKGISEKSIEKLKNFKHTHSNKFQLFSATNECKIPIQITSALIMSGSFDDMLTESRSKTMLEAILWNFLSVKEKMKCLELGESLKFDLISCVKAMHETIKTANGKNTFIKDSRYETIKKKVTPYFDVYKYNNKNPELANWFFESQLLGFSYSTNLLNIFKKICPDMIDIFNVNQSLDNDNVHFVGQVAEVKQGKSREKSTPYLRLTVKDHCGSIGVMLFNTARQNSIEECEENNGRLPEEGDIVSIRGTKKDGDTVFARNVGIQDCKILNRISQLKDLNITPEDTEGLTV